MKLDVGAILQAMRAEHIPEGDHGLWTIRKQQFTARDSAILDRMGRDVPQGTYTFLRRYTDSTLYEGGEIVMEDTPPELRKHLQAILVAHGAVLVTGLGLGCVIRGLLENPRVTEIDVVERDQSVLSLVAAHMPRGPRLRIYQDEAENFLSATRRTWDCAWHDVWTDTDIGEDHLAVKHQRLMHSRPGTSRNPTSGSFTVADSFLNWRVVMPNSDIPSSDDLEARERASKLHRNNCRLRARATAILAQ